MRRSTVNNARIRFKRGAIFTRSVTFDSAQVTSYPSDAAGGNLRPHLASPLPGQLRPAGRQEWEEVQGGAAQKRGEERKKESLGIGRYGTARETRVHGRFRCPRLPNLHHSKMGLAIDAGAVKIYIDRVS